MVSDSCQRCMQSGDLKGRLVLKHVTEPQETVALNSLLVRQTSQRGVPRQQNRGCRFGESECHAVDKG